jgi:nucleoside-diphosphate-sugar epimerase
MVAGDTSMRVSNAKAKQALGWRPQFQTFRDGIAAMVAETDAQAAVLDPAVAGHRR